MMKVLQASPCCGGGSSQTALILGDHKAVLSSHYLFSSIVIDALNDGTYLNRSSDTIEYEHSFVFESALALNERWQIGARIPLMYRYVPYESNPNNFGLGDFKLHGAYELVRVLRYNPYKPRGFVSFGITLPLGQSAFETNAASSFSRGFYEFFMGALLDKQWNKWGAQFSIDLHKGLKRDVNFFGAQTSIDPGLGTNMMASIRYSLFPKWTMSFSQSFIYNNGSGFSSGISSYNQSYFSSSLQTSYSPNDVFMFTLSYTDQTLLGRARNVSLGRMLALTLQKSFPL